MSTMRQESLQPATYADLLVYPEGQRWELIEGVPMLQSAPNWQHQFLVRELMLNIALCLHGKPCQVFPSPFDVQFGDPDDADDEVSTVLQPDLVVVCDPSRLYKSGYRGSPRLVVEIISPGTARKDMLVKYRIYQKAGVASYWIVQPEERNILQYHLNETGVYELVNVVTEADTLTDAEFPEMAIPGAGLFPPMVVEPDMEGERI